jgi:alkanesulfonate monooxygenase SsuD/methylene tetrahydromethanopterin reductase-like flavin-dependent oxidoreductase (luciferase family)
MKYGFILPFGDARIAADLARDAEQAGWDGFFLWEPICGVDAWIGLTAAAMQTTHIRLGTMLSPISRMRPWELASKAATLDGLSGGRVIVSVGLGALGTGFAQFGEVTDRKLRAERVDESLDIITGLWRGQPFGYRGKHYQLEAVADATPPRPIQQPRIPLWVVGAWPHPKSMERALKYDGLIPQGLHAENETQYQAFEEMMQSVRSQRTQTAAFDIVIDYKVSKARHSDKAETLRRWSSAGATWWIEGLWEATELLEVQQHIVQGPPRRD